MRRLALLTLLAARVFAHEPPVTRMYPLKYADVEQIRKLFSIFSYPTAANRDFNVFIVTAPPAFQSQVEAAVKAFDVAPKPPKNLELNVYLLMPADAPGAPLPKELDEIAKQLAASSSFRAFKLADSQVIRTRAGQSGETTGGQALTEVHFRAGYINSDDKGNVLSFDNLRVRLKGAWLIADVDLREGQWAVVGRANPDGVLVAMARVSE